MTQDRHTVSIRAFDASGNLDFDTVEVILDSEDPTLLFEIGDGDAIFRSGESIPLSGTTRDDWGIEKLEVNMNKKAPYDITSSIRDIGSGAWTYEFWDTTGLETGENTIYVTVYDMAGHYTTLSAVVSIDTKSPCITG